jgi:hypothetical protein
MSDYSNINLPSPAEVTLSTSADFEAKRREEYRPFVIRNFAQNWPLVKDFSSQPKSSIEYLQSIVSQQKMQLTRIPYSENSRMFYNKDMSAMNFGTAELDAKQCFSRILSNERDADYAIQSVLISQYFGQLKSSLHNPLLSDDIEPLIWLGNKVIVAPHFDEADNIAVVAAGKRRFTLFPPEQIANLYIGPLDFTPAGQAISLVDIKSPNLKTHPKYAEAFKHGFSVELQPGDAIYIPSPWWHHVESLSPYNVLINYWWSDKSVSTAMPYPMLLHAIQALNTMDAPQKNAWQNIMQHYLFDQSNKAPEHIPDHARGITGELTPELIKELDLFIKRQLL